MTQVKFSIRMKNLKISFFAIAIISIFAWNSGYSQFPGGSRGGGPTITGKIIGDLVDSLTSSPVEFATVAIRKAGTEKDINGAISDEKGHFKISEVKLGKYDVVISFIGYSTQTLTNVELTPEKPDVDLGALKMITDNVILDEIEVVGQAAVIENKVDRIVYNAEKDNSVRGGDATDVLQKVPLLSVDMDGNVSLRGSQNIQILVNGKPSGMFSSNVGDALKMIPADQIKSVEVITTPTAKYDAEGTGGIINIITKKKSIDGFSGSINSSVGNRQNNGNLSLNLAKGRFGLNGSGGFFYSVPQDAPTSFLREDYIDNQVRSLSQEGFTENSRLGFRGQAGAFYDINAYNSLNTNINFRGFSFDRNGWSDAVFTDPTINLIQNYRRSNDGTTGRNGFDWNTDYTKKFKTKGQEFVLAFQYSGDNSDNNTLNQTESDIDELRMNERNINDGKNREYTIQIDYTHPFSEVFKLEVGGKSVLRRITSDYQYLVFNQNSDNYLLDNIRSNYFNYHQDVMAGYTSMTVNINKNYSVIAGVRYESTAIEGFFDQGENPFENSYDNLVPSFIISRKFKNFSSLKLSYVQRLKRPSLRFINPFVDLSDPRNIEFGNPDLAPELTDQFDIGFTTFIKGSIVNSSVYYRKTKDAIERFLTINNEGVSETTYRNLGVQDNIGANVFSSIPLTKRWTIRGSFDVNWFTIESTIPEVDISNDGIQYRIFGNSSLAFKKGLKIDAFAFFNSPRPSLQGTFPSFSMFSFGISQELFKKRGSLGIRVVEPFNKFKAFETDLEGENFIQNSVFNIPFRSVGVNFSYRFGKLNFKAQQRRSKIRNDDLKQGDDMNSGGNQQQGNSRQRGK